MDIKSTTRKAVDMQINNQYPVKMDISHKLDWFYVLLHYMNCIEWDPYIIIYAKDILKIILHCQQILTNPKKYQQIPSEYINSIAMHFIKYGIQEINPSLLENNRTTNISILDLPITITNGLEWIFYLLSKTMFNTNKKKKKIFNKYLTVNYKIKYRLYQYCKIKNVELKNEIVRSFKLSLPIITDKKICTLQDLLNYTLTKHEANTYCKECKQNHHTINKMTIIDPALLYFIIEIKRIKTYKNISYVIEYPIEIQNKLSLYLNKVEYEYSVIAVINYKGPNSSNGIYTIDKYISGVLYNCNKKIIKQKLQFNKNTGFLILVKQNNIKTTQKKNETIDQFYERYNKYFKHYLRDKMYDLN